MKASELVDGILRVAATALGVSIAIACCHDVSKAWDVWFYHLPFAARIAGVVDPANYAFGAANQARFDGFPLLAEALQGVMWRVTGRPETASLTSFAGPLLVAGFLLARFRVPPYLTVLALFAVPLVQIHASAAYIDLQANACATVLLLCAYCTLSDREPPSLKLLAVAALAAAATANMKFQLVPIVGLASVVILVRAVMPGGARGKRLVVMAIALPLIAATPLKNLALHGNPVWPVELTVLGKTFPHVAEGYSSSPDWLDGASRPARFACSLLEVGLRPLASHARWSIDQWTPPREPGYRMGGFFGAYVVVNLAALIFAVIRRRSRSRESIVALGFFAVVTALTSVVPQSHELRYYMYWMLFLVALNLVLWAREAPRAVGLVAASALAVVAWSTSGGYLYASGDRFEELVAAKVDARAVESIPPGARVCVSREPWTFLYAPEFHPGKRYVVQEAEDLTSDCADAVPLR